MQTIDIQGSLQFSRVPELGGVEIIRADRVVGYVRMLHEDYLVTMAVRGAVNWSSRGSSYLSTGGELDLMEPGEVHSLGRFHTGTISQTLLFIPPTLIRDLANECGVPKAALHLRSLHCKNPAIYRAFATLHRSLETSSTLLERQSRFATAMKQYLGGCLGAGESDVPASPQDPRLDKAAELISSSYARELPLAELASAAGMDRFRLLRSFKARFGLSPHAYQMETRLRQGRRLLREGWSPAQTAVEVGFADQSHFSRCFRRMVGVTPGMFRRG